MGEYCTINNWHGGGGKKKLLQRIIIIIIRTISFSNGLHSTSRTLEIPQSIRVLVPNMALKTFSCSLFLASLPLSLSLFLLKPESRLVAKSEAIREVGEFETSIRPRCKKYEYITARSAIRLRNASSTVTAGAPSTYGRESAKRLFAVRSASSITN